MTKLIIEDLKEPEKLKNYKLNIFVLLGRQDLKNMKILFPQFNKLSSNYGFTLKTERPFVFTPTDYPGKIVGVIGEEINDDLDRYRKLAVKVIKLINREGIDNVVVNILDACKLNEEKIKNFVDYLLLNTYGFIKYRSSKSLKDYVKIRKITLCFKGATRYSGLIRKREIISENVSRTRDLVNDTPHSINPESIISYTEDLFDKYNCIKLSKFFIKNSGIRKLNGLEAVGRSSPYRSVMMKIEYSSSMKSKKHIAFVGKGVTFDSGGLNIKTGSHMRSMKSDMSGAAAVIGLIKTAADLGSGTDITGYVPVAENMPGKDAYKPDDIIQFKNGKSVEVINTDAEGRLLLADALCLAAEDNIDSIIEFSTLTGSIVNALGELCAGLMCNNKRLSESLLESASLAGEKLCSLPMIKEYKKSIISEIADLKNSGYGSASSIKSALFLNEFSGKKPFAHIDIAGTAFLKKPNDYYLYGGATGFGVRLGIEYLLNKGKN